MTAPLLLLVGHVSACPPPAELDDRDADGWDDDADCRPDDPSAYPGADDAWGDGVDTNCDGLDGVDGDGDGWAGNADGGRPDCDDAVAGVNPGEFWDPPYDGVDSDCDGSSSMHALAPDVVVSIESANSSFGAGRAVADIDGDGFDDIFVGAPRHSAWQGRVFGFRGVDLALGQPLDAEGAWWIIEADPLAPGAGWYLDLAGDADGDSIPDLLVISQDDWPGDDAAQVVFGARLREHRTIGLDTADVVIRSEGSDGWLDALGVWVGDIDGDGLTDLAVSGRDDEYGAVVRLFTAAQIADSAALVESDAHAVIRGDGDPASATALGLRTRGRSIAVLPDQDGDGDDELLIGDPARGRVHGILGGLPYGTVLVADDAPFGLYGGGAQARGYFGAEVAQVRGTSESGLAAVAIGAPWVPQDASPDSGGGYLLLVNPEGLVSSGWQYGLEVGSRLVGPAWAENVGLAPYEQDLNADGVRELVFWVAGSVEEYGWAVVDPAATLDASPGSTLEIDALGVMRSGDYGFVEGTHDINGDGLLDTILSGGNGEYGEGAVAVIFGPAKD